MRLFVLLCTALLLSACDSDSKTEAEREAFRAELIDKALNDNTRKLGDQFLAANATKAGVVVRPSGLQYIELQAGSGPKPTLDQYVVVNYEGQRVDGVQIDASKPGKPATFPLNQVIRGWREGLSLMSKGAKWELYVPADLAYGATSPSDLIPANSTLIFTVELVDILDTAQKEAQ